MDKNELLNQKYSLLFRHYWFFKPILNAPSWQRYCLTLLIIGVIISSWYLYWYAPQAERQLLHKQNMQTNQQQQRLLERLQQQAQLLSTPSINSLSTADAIASLINLAEQQGITIISYSPASAPHHEKISSDITVHVISLLLQSKDYPSLLIFIKEMVREYPTIEILDMLIRKSECGLTIAIQLQLITRTYEIPSVTTIPATSYSIP